jgi:hypothetical protein
MKASMTSQIHLAVITLAVAVSACEPKTAPPDVAPSTAVAHQEVRATAVAPTAVAPTVVTPSVVPASPIDQVKAHFVAPADAKVLQALATTADGGTVEARYCFQQNAPEVIAAVTKALTGAGWEVGQPMPTAASSVIGIIAKREALSATIKVGRAASGEDLTGSCGSKDPVQAHYSFR